MRRGRSGFHHLQVKEAAAALTGEAGKRSVEGQGREALERGVGEREGSEKGAEREGGKEREREREVEEGKGREREKEEGEQGQKKEEEGGEKEESWIHYKVLAFLLYYISQHF
mmetsp:Transcript_25899/g.47325  ORF Transcript_25899/g.47325 Transcript_25899/m.47325 type:complete len:113 (-) Transcript_25899:1138-1476(-)